MNLIRLLIISCQIVFPGFVTIDLYLGFSSMFGIFDTIQFCLLYVFFCLFHVFVKKYLPPHKIRLIIISKIIFVTILFYNSFFIFGFGPRFVIFGIMLILAEVIFYLSEINDR